MMENKFEHYCNFCNEKEALYYCNHCSLIFCNRCADKEVKHLIICSSCFSPIEEFDFNEDINGKFFKCPECKSIKYKEATKNVKLCPSCRHGNILTIAEKKRVFIKSIRDSAVLLRQGFDKLSVFISRIEKIKHGLHKLRVRGYLHEFTIEKILFELYNQMPAIKDKLAIKTRQDYELLKNQLANISNLKNWVPHNFPSIESTIDQVIETAKSHSKFVHDTFNPLNKQANIINAKLEAINFFKNIFDEFQDSLLLLPGELPVCAFKEIKFKKYTSDNIKAKKGTLFFTDRRIIFLIKKGFLFRKNIKHFDFLLEGFENATIKGRIFKKINIAVDTGELVFAAKRNLLKAILQYFNVAINFEKYRVSDKISNRLFSIKDLDLMDLKSTIETYITELLNFQNIGLQPSAKQFTFRPPTYQPIRRKPLTYRKPIESRNIFNDYNPSHRSTCNGNIFDGYDTPVEPERHGNIFDGYAEQSQEDNNFSFNENEMILKLEREKFNVENTISSLEDKYHKGYISSEEFLRHYKLSQDKLFKITEQLEELRKYNMTQHNYNEILSFR